MIIKVYFAHSVKDYNTDYENLNLELIEEWLKFKYVNMSYEIENPRDFDKAEDDNIFNDMRINYYSVIDTCNALIYIVDNKSKKITRGVEMEIQYAKSKGIKVINIDEINDEVERLTS